METLYKLTTNVATSPAFIAAAMLIFAGKEPEPSLNPTEHATMLDKAGYRFILSAMGSHPKVIAAHAAVVKEGHETHPDMSTPEGVEWFTRSVHKLAAAMLSGTMGVTGINVTMRENLHNHRVNLVRATMAQEFGVKEGDSKEEVMAKILATLDGIKGEAA